MATLPPTTTDPDLMVIPVSDFTEAKVDGEGVYDILMKANAAHLEREFNSSRIKGSEYAQIYLGTMQATMQTAVSFFIQRHKLGYEAKILEMQAKIAEVELEKARVALEIAQLEATKIPVEIEKLRSDILVNEANIGNIGADTARTAQQTKNLVAEALNIPKQGLILDSQKQKADKEVQVLTAEILNIPKQGELLTAQKKRIDQEVTNLTAEAVNIPKQGKLIDAQSNKVDQEIVNLGAQKLQTVQETANAVIQGTVLTAQKCKLDAEYDVLVGQKLKVVQETSLLQQKISTEKAQTVGASVSPDSVIGKQLILYQSQADGFRRDAEQKAAQILISTWNARRTTDEATQANASNQLHDPMIGRVVGKLASGVGA